METDFYKIAEELAGCPVEQLIPCHSGRNSMVYKVECANADFALKSYPPKASDPRDRFGTEINALKFYEANHNPYTPRLLAIDTTRCIALIEWIAGRPVNAPSVDDIDQAIDFIALTHTAAINGGESFGLAAEPCLCGADLYRHILLRLEKLVACSELNCFLTHELADALEAAKRHAGRIDYFTPLPKPGQSLIPADFGFHNAIKTGSGRLNFIDFEYFGWDDPVRLTADFLLHPGIELNEENRHRFQQGMISVFQADENFERRLLHLLPLFGIRWALILLNEFLPERWQARVFAGETATWEEIKEQQLKKSRIAADKVNNYLRHPWS